MKSLSWYCTLACILALTCFGGGCSRIVVTPAAQEATAEYLKDPTIQALFPEKVKNLDLAMIDEQVDLPEFGFSWEGYRGVYQRGGQQLEVLVLEKMGRDEFKTLHDAVKQTAIENGDNADRLRLNNASYTFWSKDGRVYRFFPLDGDVIVFRTQKHVSQLPLVKDYLQKRTTAVSLAAN
jgi:hypothetical protein